MNRSRLSKRLERQSIKNLLLSIFGILFIVVVLLKFGVPLLVNFSLFVSGTKSQDTTVNSKTSFVPSPILNSQEVATNSAKIQIEGSALPNHTIVLYVNGALVDKIQIGKEGNFSSTVTLTLGENIIKARATNPDGQESTLSEGLIIVFKSEGPNLEIMSPSDGYSFSRDQNTIEIKGKTDHQVRVTVNNFWAIIDEDNNFSYTLALKDGENEIKVVAEDFAGNKTEKSIKVTYNP